MKYQFSDLSQSDVLLIAKKEQTNLAKTYHFKHLDFLNLVIPDRYLAWEIEYQPEDSMKKAALRKAVDEYNQYLQALEAIPGFLDEFIVRGKCISREFVEKHWSAATAQIYSSTPAARIQSAAMRRATWSGCRVSNFRKPSSRQKGIKSA